MKRLHRFTLQSNFRGNAGYKALRKYARRYKNDQLRSRKSALNSLRASVRRNPLYWRFSDCLTAQGYKDAIGFKCGRHMESAACMFCRYVARLRIMEIFYVRTIFRKNCVQLTIVDTENEVPTGRLHTYDQDEFLRIIQSIAKRVSAPIKFIGQIEYGIRTNDDQSDRMWSPHVHMIVTGPGRREFIAQCRNVFRSSRQYARPVVQQRLKKRSDILRAAAYQTKSSFARRDGTLALTSIEKIELCEFFLEKSCSDLLVMHGVNFRSARVQVSSGRDLKIWNAIHGIPSFFEERYDRRIVPSVKYELRRQLFDIRGNLLLDKLEEHRRVITEQLVDH